MQTPLSRTLPRLSWLPLLLHRPPPPKTQLSQPSRRTYTTPVLAKPTKFTPPSHPPSLPRRDPVNYPGPPTHRDPTKRYPNTMPPPNTWSHYFLTSRVLHFYISISVLLVLGTWASVMNFLRTTDRGREVEGELSWGQPLDSMKRFLAAYRLHAHDRSLLVAEMRRRKVEDVDKRAAYRRAHGLEQVRAEGGGRGVHLGAEREEAGRVLRGLGAVVGVEESPTGGKGGWVEEEIRRAEEEVEKAVATRVAAGAGTAEEGVEGAAAPAQEVKVEKRKGSWWSRG